MPTQTNPKAKAPLKERLKDLLAEYGRIALITYLVLFALVFIGFLIAISAGFETDSGSAGSLGAAWLATKVTQPIRIGAALLLTPLVAKLVRRSSHRDTDDAAADGDEDEGEKRDAADETAT